MPNWKFHNEWAAKMGISKKVSQWVNMREDLPQFEKSDNKSLQAFRETIPDTPPTYGEMLEKGEEYLRAWILHLLLDELENICDYFNDKCGEGAFPKGTDLYGKARSVFFDTDEVMWRFIPREFLGFFEDNFDEIIRRMPIPYFSLNRDILFDGEAFLRELDEIGARRRVEHLSIQS